MGRVGDDSDPSPGHIRNKIQACLDQGITTIDQADIYGGYAAEELLGAALAGTDLRDQIEIVTKCDIVAPMGRYADARGKYYDTSSEHLQASVEHSLRLMGIEYIDTLLIHRPDPFMDHRDTGAALDALVESGKVRSIGASNFRPHDLSLLQSAMEQPLVTDQIELSVLCHEAFTNGDLACLQEHDIPAMAWSPLGGGKLFDAENQPLHHKLKEIGERTGHDASGAAIAWLLAHPAHIVPVMGTNKLERIAKFSEAFEIAMDRQTWFEIYTAALGHEVP
ncbi:MAG TPA: oxidoreductase, partial [Deltaproteobacteria bacterium]|nr:oxidoreductase [Deltaproteobacteria bacterium]